MSFLTALCSLGASIYSFIGIHVGYPLAEYNYYIMLHCDLVHNKIIADVVLFCSGRYNILVAKDGQPAKLVRISHLTFL